MKKPKEEDAPIVPPSGSIPAIQTSQSLETAVTLSAFVIAMMVGLYVLVMLAWGWLTVLLMLALPKMLDDAPLIVDILWYTLAAVVVIVLIFLIKPLLPLRRRPAPPIELNEADQPELFAYIRALAKCIDAPEPERVQVDVHANASASFAGGMSPTSGPMTLTLGLPLVGGMSVRQLAGVIAHELGHFSQGSMVKQNIVIGFVSGWLTEVALGEDKFDYVIHRMSVSAPPLLRHVFKIIRTVTNAIRRVFYVVMVVGHLVTRMAARQLEYDADQYMTHTTGSKHFADTMRETIVLGHAGMQAIQDAAQFYRDRRLPNDLPAMVVTRARRMDDKQRKKLIRGEDRGEVEAFSTHPLTSKRIDAAMALGSDGLVHDDRPARGLFRDFEKLCRDASEAMYKEVIGKEYDPKHLTDSSRLIAELEATDKARKAAQRFCQSDLLLMSPVFPTYRGLRMPSVPKMALEEIKEMRQRARQMRDQAYPLMRKLHEAHDKLMDLRQAHLATQAGFQIRDFQQMGLEAGDAAGLSRAVSDQTRVVDQLENQVREYNADLIKRMELDFALLKHPKVSERMGEARVNKIWGEVEALVPAGQALASVQENYENLRVQANTLAMGVHLLMNGLISYRLIDKIKHTARETTGEIKDILRTLANKPYPFAHGDGRVTMAEAVCEKPPVEDNLGDILFVADDMAGRLIELRERIIGRLCHHAERIEKVMGMKPLPAPDEPDALEGLLEKIGVDDAPVQDEAPSTSGLVGALMVQGVMGVAVLALSGWGVYALLPNAPADDLADDPSTPRVAQDDRQPDDPRTSNPGFNPPARDEGRPTRPTPPDRTNPRPEPEPQPPTAQEMLELLGDRSRVQQMRGLQLIVEYEPSFSTLQQDQAVERVVAMLYSHNSRQTTEMGLDLMRRYTDDDGLDALSKGLTDDEPLGMDRLVIEHVAEIDERAAADLLIRLGQHSRYTSSVEDAFEDPPMSKYAEDALLAKLESPDAAADRNRLNLVRMLAAVGTAKSLDMFKRLSYDNDRMVSREALSALQRLDPRKDDEVAQFLRLARTNPTGSQTTSAMRRLASIEPAEDEDRKPEVSRALVQWMRSTRANLDDMMLAVLEKWGDAAAVPTYLEVLKDERSNRTYVKNAIQLAGAQTDEARAEEVASAIANWFLMETDAVADGLIAMGEQGEAPAIQYLKSKHSKVRLGCIKVLAEVGTDKGLAALRGMGDDSDRAVREVARKAFYELRDRLKEQDEQNDP